jgi:hypothetical protein
MFFYESSSPKPLKITIGSFPVFFKFAEIFASQGTPLVSTTKEANLPLVSKTAAANIVTGTAGVVDTG